MKNIIYIEDDPLQAALVQENIVSLGHQCQVFYSMAFFILHVKHSILKIDLIISDVNGVSILGVGEDLKNIKAEIVVTSLVSYSTLNHKFVPKHELDEFIKSYLKT